MQERPHGARIGVLGHGGRLAREHAVQGHVQVPDCGNEWREYVPELFRGGKKKS